MVDFIRRPIEMEHYKQHPFSLPLTELIGHERCDYRQVCRSSVGEGISGAVTTAPGTQAASALILASDGASNDGRLARLGQIADDARRGKALIQYRTFPLNPAC